MIEIWQLIVLVLLWFAIYMTCGPIGMSKASKELFKQKIKEEIKIGLDREKQMRIRLGLEPVIK